VSAEIAYFDCFSGASGDMLLGALLDAGLDLDQLERDLQSLDLTDYKLSLKRQVRHGISGVKFDVVDERHSRPARGYREIRSIIEGSKLPPEVAEASLGVFRRLAEVEAQIHETSIDEVHFHEIGAIDTLVDIVGFCCAMRRLGIKEVYASPLPTGSGSIVTEHGLLPLPAPATLALLASVGAPIVPSDARCELVTPTAAALLASLARFSRPPMMVRRVGYGFGTRELPWANMVRVWIGKRPEPRVVPPHAHYAGHDAHETSDGLAHHGHEEDRPGGAPCHLHSA
jgi:uncharacterized protein (TIGR00299 family) protein